MEIDQVRTVAVVGAGTMGSQIAIQGALYGYDVWLVDQDSEQLRRAQESNRHHLQRRVAKERMTQTELEATLGAVHVTTDLEEAAAGAQFVIEAVVERLEDKANLFGQLDALCPPGVILASNSSTIAISSIVSAVLHPERCLNMHFFHPVLVMKLVEVMRGPRTSDETVLATVALTERIGKEAVVIKREVHGLLVNRILGAIKREAFWLAEEGYATPEDIDRAVKLGLNHPMGPFELSDFSGLDIYYYAALERYRETGDERDRPPRILEEKVNAGHLGRKTGRGFYEYGDGSAERL